MLQPRYLPGGALAECFMDLDLCNALKKEKSHVSLFLGVWTGSWTLLSAQCRQLSHHSSITSPQPCVLPSGLEQLQRSRKAAGRAGDEEGKGEQAMPWARLQEKKQGLLDTQALSLYHWGPQWYPSQGCPALLLMICSAGKKIYKCFAGHIPLLFMSAPLNTHLLQSSLQHCVFGTSSYSYISKFTSLLWLAGARDISSPQWCSWEDVCSGGMQKSSSKFFVFWQTLLKDFALTWARHGTGRCCASFPRSTGSASWIWPATTAPPWAPFPLPSQPRPAFILSRESSPCQIAWWFSDVNRWD